MTIEVSRPGSVSRTPEVTRTLYDAKIHGGVEQQDRKPSPTSSVRTSILGLESRVPQKRQPQVTMDGASPNGSSVSTSRPDSTATLDGSVSGPLKPNANWIDEQLEVVDDLARRDPVPSYTAAPLFPNPEATSASHLQHNFAPPQVPPPPPGMESVAKEMQRRAELQESLYTMQGKLSERVGFAQMMADEMGALGDALKQVGKAILEAIRR
ncbi:hypothetical protein AB3X96_38845 [Paraburkholderia sp. BR13439]|uniref:hypothetical protein n=1 Tax=Paraburkholderia sp. BR13439 TaxID=3236996 RepID=UPI0034CECDE8